MANIGGNTFYMISYYEIYYNNASDTWLHKLEI